MSHGCVSCSRFQPAGAGGCSSAAAGAVDCSSAAAEAVDCSSAAAAAAAEAGGCSSAAAGAGCSCGPAAAAGDFHHRHRRRRHDSRPRLRHHCRDSHRRRLQITATCCMMAIHACMHSGTATCTGELSAETMLRATDSCDDRRMLLFASFLPNRTPFWGPFLSLFTTSAYTRCRQNDSVRTLTMLIKSKTGGQQPSERQDVKSLTSSFTTTATAASAAATATT